MSDIKGNENSSNSNAATLNNIKMLVIDDDIGLCDSIKFFFEDFNCIVHSCYDGRRALYEFSEIKPDVVIVDLNMPGVHGTTIISEIYKKNNEIPIIVVSGTGLIKEAVESLNVGAWDFVSKPIMNLEELEISVLKALEKSALRKENRLYKESLEKLVTKRTRELEYTINQLKVAKEKAELSEKLKSEFLAQMSHEIRTPINAILSFSSLIKMEMQDKEDSTIISYFDVINRASQRLIRTIDLILDLSELSIGAYNYSPQYFDITEIIDEAILLYGKRIKAKGVNFLYNLKSDPVQVFLDKYSIQQIISNLMDNAYKFTERGTISIATEKANGHILIYIKDTGVGISEEYLPKIFESFTQEDQGYTREFDGNGLGLALTKKYCEMNGITINIKSIKNEGTTVTLGITI
jgi:signal transduction histidine kinase